MQLALAALVAAGVLMLLVPLPAAVVDIALSAQLAFAVLVLLGCARGGRGPDALAVVPTLLVATTCLRLALNVSTTRLILAHGDAGAVVRSLGGVAIAENLVAGAVVFAIIALAQLLVVTRGAERAAEVAARFSLDAVPGRQLAIDADIRAGFIDAREADRRRRAVVRESRFFGAMDGAMRFVKGDAMVALAIAVINIVGGAVVGLTMRDMAAGEALQVYLTLAIGDGLAAQIPALLVAIAAGLALTRGARDEADDEMPGDARGSGPGGRDSLFTHPGTWAAVAGLFALLAVIPGLPGAPFAGTGLAAAGVWLWTKRVQFGGDDRRPPAAGRAREYLVATPTPAPSRARVEVELGPGLAAAVDAGRADGEFVHTKLTPLRRRLAESIGVAAPALAVRVVSQPGFRLRLDGVVIATATPSELAAAGGDALPAPATALGERVWAGLAPRAFELVEVQAVSDRLRELSGLHPALVREVVPGLLGLVQLTELTRALLRERVDFADMATLLRAVARALGDRPASAPVTPEARLARVRIALRARITARYAPTGVLAVYRLDPMVEDEIHGAVVRESGVPILALEPQLRADIAAAVADALTEEAAGKDSAGASEELSTPVLLVASDVRPLVAELLAAELPSGPSSGPSDGIAIAVLAPPELEPGTRIRTRAVIGV